MNEAFQTPSKCEGCSSSNCTKHPARIVYIISHLYHFVNLYEYKIIHKQRSIHAAAIEHDHFLENGCF